MNGFYIGMVCAGVLLRSTYLTLSLLAMAFLLNGCFSLTHKLPTNQTLSISSIEGKDDEKRKSEKVILIDEIESAGILDSEKIILVKPPRIFDFFAGYEWSENAPEMIY